MNIQVIINIIQRIFDFIVSYFHKEIEKPKNIKVKHWDVAEKFLEENRMAYYPGYNKYATGNIKGTPYTSKLFIKDKDKYYIIHRNFKTDGLYYLVDVELISKDEYDKKRKKASYQTYCNIWAGAITKEFTKRPINKWDGHEHTANNIYKSLEQGKFNIDAYKWQLVDWTQALKNAAINNCTIAVSKNLTGSGHISILSGETDGRAIKNNIIVYTAGGFIPGYMTLKKSFGRFTKKIKFYSWMKV